MKEKQRITVSGNHWDDIIKLPCFSTLVNVEGELRLSVYAYYFDGHPTKYHNVRAVPGDALVEYDDGKWGIIREEYNE